MILYFLLSAGSRKWCKPWVSNPIRKLGARLRGRTAAQRSKKGSEKVLRRGRAVGFTVKRVLRRVLRRDSKKGVSRRCLERSLGECAPLGVCLSKEAKIIKQIYHMSKINPSADQNYNRPT